ncbi:DUF362 domain-containing protein [Anaerotalea alkaliphila]|uniref:DUF362 domain-containing protein n=1 Tax=Anaerotalea alkaliphila TaxID=2662126 RepID=A0A7X5KPR5_9FIRM|nr:DUF362 domain-containing protein [Anaerotalea alkaliphila]NDL68837.1 DUF362 domain-containing protein [Anaerotalea alkaliphila]
MSKVALVRCEDYREDKVLQAVERGLDLLGGPGAFLRPGEKILLKPNLVAADPPERCSTTHPAVFGAVAKVLQKAGAQLSYGDSPGFHSPGAAAKASGIGEVARALQIPLADFVTGRTIFYQEGIQNKRFVIANGIFAQDGLVSLPKLKTHGFARMTGCIKNQFGCIPGKLKGEMHVKLPSALDFSRMLVDLNRYIAPRLYVMDGILAMEGEGPRGGTPKPMRVLLFSADPVALDATVCRMIGLDPALVPTTVYGQETGMGSMEGVELVGDPFDSFLDEGFEVKREPVKPYRKGALLKALNNLVIPKPYILEEKCVKCGVCVLMCPVKPKALQFPDRSRKTPPVYHYQRCIRCYCCHELCPKSAIRLQTPVLRRALDRLGLVQGKVSRPRRKKRR